MRQLACGILGAKTTVKTSCDKKAVNSEIFVRRARRRNDALEETKKRQSRLSLFAIMSRGVRIQPGL